VSLTRPRHFGRAAYLLAVVVNEIPHVAALYLALATVLGWSQGDLSGTLGLVLTIAAAVTMAGLLEVGRRGLTAPEVVDSALSHSGIRPRKSRPQRRMRALLTPIPVRSRGVRRIRNVHYGEHRRQRLDVYRRSRNRTGGPVLVYLHGGGYFSGGKHRESRALLHHFAARGWVCVSATYRLRPRADFTDHLDDARAALAWAHDNAGRHGGDVGAVVMAGSSAGAHLTALCALTQHEQAEPTRSRVDVAVCLYGYYGRYYGRGPVESPVSSPLHLDATKAPPFFVAHGDRDTYVPVGQARAFAEHLRRQSQREVAYAELPGAQHGFDLFRSWRFAAVVHGIDTFCAGTLSRTTPPIR
jgi:acetyl esterase/lipase